MAEVGDVELAEEAPAQIQKSEISATKLIIIFSLISLVLASAGVGLTPLVSMLHALAPDPARPVWFVHGARDGLHHPLRDEVQALVYGAEHVQLHVTYSRPRPEDRAGRDFQSRGRVDAALLEKLTANPPVTRAMLGVLNHDDDVDPAEPCQRLGIELTPLDEVLRRCVGPQAEAPA